MKVLIGVDGSANSFEAVRLAAKLLSPSKDSIALYYAPPHGWSPWGSRVDEATRRTISSAIMVEAKSHLPEAFGDGVHEIIENEDPRPGLLNAAKDWKADVLALGARGTGPVQRLLLGSVSRAVVHAATIPVLVARGTVERQTGDGMHVLLASKEARFSQRMASLLQDFTWPAGTQCCAATVIESMFPGALPAWLEDRPLDAETKVIAQAWLQEHEAERLAKTAAIEHFCEQLTSPCHDARPIVAEGNPIDQILRIIAQEEIDLVILSARKHGAVERWLLGSTSEAVLSHAPCSVLLVPDV